MAGPVTPVPTPATLGLATKYTPSTAAAITRSQYLAEALRQMSAESQNIHSPGELLARLGADAIAQSGFRRSQQDLAASYGADQSRRIAAAITGLGMDSSEVIPPAAPMPAPAAGNSIIQAIRNTFGGGAPANAPPPQSAIPPSTAANPVTPPAVSDPTKTDGVQLGTDAYGAPARSGPAPPPLAPQAPAASDDPAMAGAQSSPAPYLTDAPSQSAPQASPAVGQVSPQDRDALARMVAVEAGGEGPVGMAAAAHVALNRYRSGYGGAKSLSDIVYQPHQFEAIQRGVQPDPRALAVASQIADGVIGGQIPDPTGGAMAFLNPELQVNGWAGRAGRPLPAWAQGQGQRIGNHVFFGGNPQLAQNGAAPGAPGAPAGPDAVDQGPSGAAPPADLGAMGMGAQPFAAPQGAPASPAPAPPPPSAMPPPSPQGVPQAPPSPLQATAQQKQLLRQYLTSPDPAMREHGIAYAQALQEKLAEQFKYESQTVNGLPAWIDPYHPGNVKVGALPPEAMTRTIAGRSPSDFAQQAPTGVVTHSAIPGVQGPVPEGKVFDATTGGYVSIAGGQPRALIDPKERAAWGIQPGDRNGYAIGADGKIMPTAPDPFGPKEQMAYTAQVTGLEPYKNYVLGRGYLSAMQNLNKQTGGFADLGMIENAGKTVNPTVAIRPNMIEQYAKEVGWPDWLQGEVSSVMNHGGHLSAQGRNALLNIAQANVQSHWEQLQPVLKKVDHDAARYGVSREDLIPDLVPMAGAPPPSYPESNIPTFGGGPVNGNNPQAAMLNEARSAIARGADPAKVRARLQASGINPAAL